MPYLFVFFFFLFFKDLSRCTATGFRTLENRHKTLVFKELRRLWEKHDSTLPWEKGEYNETNTLLLDDSPYKALLNPVSSFHLWFSFHLTNAIQLLYTLCDTFHNFLCNFIDSPRCRHSLQSSLIHTIFRTEVTVH